VAIALTGVFVWDGVSEHRSPEPWTVRIEGERIAELGPARSGANGARVLPHFGEATALPGLIDAHVHLTLDPEIGSAREQDAVPREERERRMAARAARMLRAGITTARDLGGGEGLELALRDRIAAGELEGPRLLCAGQPVTRPDGHCHFWGGGAASVDEARSVVCRQAERRADWIKVMATGGVFTPGSRPSDAQFDAGELAAIVAEAGERGLPVAAHCHGTAGIRNAARAGVRTLEHCSFAGREGFGSDFDAELVGEMASRELWVSPTVNAGWGRRLRKDDRATPFALRMARVLRALVAAGVPLVASTDAGIPGVAHHRLPEALSVFALLAGLSPLAALRSATSESARALGIAHETGALRPGLAADVLVVDGNPLQDLRALRRPLRTLARGRPSRSPRSGDGKSGDVD
jgi:imidazolonepropionase-like amidohydrolase